MKKIVLTAIVGLMFSCSNKKVKYEKPFMIVFSYPNTMDSKIDGIAHYEAQDINGERINFYDKNYKYSVGDTLK